MSTRIVLLANNIDEIGGAQRVVHALAAGFVNRGHDVTVVGIETREPRGDYSAAGYRVERLLEAAYDKDEGPNLDAQRAAALQKLQKILDSGPKGIIITAQVWAMEHIAQCAIQAWGTVGQYHSSFQAASFGPDLKRVIDAYRDCDRFLALTTSDAQLFTTAGLNNAAAMPNPLAQWPPRQSQTRSRTITYLGRFSAEKAPMTLMHAWRILVEAGQLSDWNLQFVGSGPHEGQIREAAAMLPRVQLRDQVADPFSVLTETGILAVPSLVEGSPLVMMEALSCGVPVVASDCSAGVRELLADESCGVLVNRGDPKDLAHGLLMLALDDARRASMAARGPQVMDGYRLEVVLDRWEQVFTDVLR
ncbi:MAG: glycosyltransferase [Actinomycetota bacterium]|nr:glycosyltransferase [Actinomycetota bacterium]